MNRPLATVAAVGVAPAVALAVLLTTTRAPAGSPPETPPGIVVPAAAPHAARTPARSPDDAARRALAWQLDTEAGRGRPHPRNTFTDALARELLARPPRPTPDSTRRRLLGFRAQTPLREVHRLLASVSRGNRREHLTVLVVCRPDCHVASIE